MTPGRNTAAGLFVVVALALPLLACAPGLAQGTPPMQEARQMEISRGADRAPARGPAEYFTGTAWVTPLFSPGGPSQVGAASVRFEPGARTAWHTHPRGQRLVVTEGLGRAQVEGGPVRELRPGDVVWFPPGVRHWHGAAPGTAMTHIAIQEAEGGKVVDWLEPVTDGQYRADPRGD